MAKPFKLNDDRLLSVEPETRAIARAVCRGCAACRSSARMGTPIWSGSRRTRRYRTPPRCCWRPTLAGCYPILKLGPASWFHDSPEGMRRFREQTTETAGFYNTVGFNDDTRAFLSIPARHDVARRVDCGFLARLLAEHRLDEDVARELAIDLANNLRKRAYRLDRQPAAPIALIA